MLYHLLLVLPKLLIHYVEHLLLVYFNKSLDPAAVPRRLNPQCIPEKKRSWHRFCLHYEAHICDLKLVYVLLDNIKQVVMTTRKQVLYFSDIRTHAQEHAHTVI